MPTKALPSSRPAGSSLPRPAPPSSALRVVAPRSGRRHGLIALALVLVLAGATLAAAVYLRAGQRIQVLAVARPVPVGHVISDQDLIDLSLSVDPRLHPLPASARQVVVGQTATVNLLPGTLLLRQMVTRGSLLAPGEGLVGLALKPGQVPEQIAPGDLVQVVQTPAASSSGTAPSAIGQGQGVVLANRARVLSVTVADGGDTTKVSLAVPLADAGVLYRAQATGQLALVVLPAP